MTTSKRKPTATRKAAAPPAAKDAAAPARKRAAAAANFPVVGIGASAGGLAAIEEFFAAVPAGEPLGMAFVLVQHLDPSHKSLLLDLVKRYAHIAVSYTHLRAHETDSYLVCRLLLEKKKKKKKKGKKK